MRYRILLILSVIYLVASISNAQVIKVDNWTVFNSGLKCASCKITIGTKIDSIIINFLIGKGYYNINKTLKESSMDYIVIEPEKKQSIISSGGVTLYKTTEAKKENLIEDNIYSWAKKNRIHVITFFTNNTGVIYKIFFVKLFDTLDKATNFEQELNKQLFDLEQEYLSVRCVRDGSKVIILFGFNREEDFYFNILLNFFRS